MITKLNPCRGGLGKRGVHVYLPSDDRHTGDGASILIGQQSIR